MNTANQPPRNELSDQQRPPVQPIPPSMDLGFVAPPIDPLGMSMQPTPSTEQVRGDGKKPTTATWFVVFGVVFVIVIAIALWVTFVS